MAGEAWRGESEEMAWTRHAIKSLREWFTIYYQRELEVKKIVSNYSKLNYFSSLAKRVIYRTCECVKTVWPNTWLRDLPAISSVHIRKAQINVFPSCVKDQILAHRDNSSVAGFNTGFCSRVVMPWWRDEDVQCNKHSALHLAEQP